MESNHLVTSSDPSGYWVPKTIGQWSVGGKDSSSRNQSEGLEGWNHEWSDARVEEDRVEVLKPTWGTQTNGSKDGAKNPNFTCNKCKEKGHIAKNCPKKGTRQGDTKDDRDKPSNPYRVKLKDDKAQVKTINSVECSWCDCCKWWMSGAKRHSTAQHKTRMSYQVALVVELLVAHKLETWLLVLLPVP